LPVVKIFETKGVSKHEYKPNTNIFNSKEATTPLVVIFRIQLPINPMRSFNSSNLIYK